MKLSEAMLQQRDIQHHIDELRDRLRSNLIVQEGGQPAEDPEQLLAELDKAIAQLIALTQRISRTTATTRFDETRTISDVLAERESLVVQWRTLANLVKAASLEQIRCSRSSGTRYVPTIDVQAVQWRVDGMSRRYRELDSAIKKINWQVELTD